MNIRPKCTCEAGTSLMFCCSGVADTAEIGDHAVRALHKAGDARMFCLAGISGDADPIISGSREAGVILVVDGCDSDCARKTLEKAGFSGFFHFRVTDLGWEKGKTPVTEEHVQLAPGRLRSFLRQPTALPAD